MGHKVLSIPEYIVINLLHDFSCFLIINIERASFAAEIAETGNCIGII